MTEPQPDPSALGHWLATQRERTGKTQKEVMLDADISERTVIRWEGDDPPDYTYEWLMYLRSIGLLAHAPEDLLPPPVGEAVRALEHRLEEVAALVAEGFARLEAGISALEKQLPGEAHPGHEESLP